MQGGGSTETQIPFTDLADLNAPLMGTASVGPGGVLSLSTSIAPVLSVGISKL